MDWTGVVSVGLGLWVRASGRKAPVPETKNRVWRWVPSSCQSFHTIATASLGAYHRADLRIHTSNVRYDRDEPVRSARCYQQSTLAVLVSGG